MGSDRASHIPCLGIEKVALKVRAIAHTMCMASSGWYCVRVVGMSQRYGQSINWLGPFIVSVVEQGKEKGI